MEHMCNAVYISVLILFMFYKEKEGKKGGGEAHKMTAQLDLKWCDAG